MFSLLRASQSMMNTDGRATPAPVLASKSHELHHAAQHETSNAPETTKLDGHNAVDLYVNQVFTTASPTSTMNFTEVIHDTRNVFQQRRSWISPPDATNSHNLAPMTTDNYLNSLINRNTEDNINSFENSNIEEEKQQQQELRIEASLSRNLLLEDVLYDNANDVTTIGCLQPYSLNYSRNFVCNNSGNISDDYGADDYTYDYDSEETVLPLGEVVAVSLFYSFTLTVGVVGNLLVIAAVARDRRLRSITNLFLTSLASADLALLCFCVPVKCVAFFTFSWTFGFLLCKSVNYFQVVAMVCSVMTLTVMSIERNIAILFPLRSKMICTRSRARILVVLIWAGSSVLALPILAVQKHKMVGVKHRVYWCLKEWDSPMYAVMFESYMLVLLFLVPVGVMVVSYTAICLELSRGTKFRRQATSTLSSTTYRGYASHRGRQGNCGAEIQTTNSCRDSMLHNRHKERMDQEKMKVIRMLIVVVVLFAICWGPILINNLLVALNVIDKLHVGPLKPLRQTIFLMSYLNSSLNPLVYGFMSRHFRRGFREAICVCCSSRRRGRDNRGALGRRNNDASSNYPSEGGTSIVRTGTIRLSPVSEQMQMAVSEDLVESPVGNKKFSRKIWARTDRITHGLQLT